jgi:hypothetical protein
MNKLQTTFCAALILTSITISHKLLSEQISELNMKKVVHTYIPDDASCAVKLMHLKDASGDTFAIDRMVCHWSQL